MPFVSRIDVVQARSQALRENQLDEVVSTFRFRDQDLSSKGGGLLGFSGLMMASDLVFLSAEKEKSFLNPQPPWAYVAFAAVFVLAVGAWFAYKSMSKTGDYRQDKTARAFLERFERLLYSRGLLLRIGAAFTTIGTVAFLLAMVASVFGLRLP